MKEERTLKFGKYKGLEIKYIILTHIGYIMWCFENISWFKLTNEEQAIYDAVAIMIKKYDIEATFPRELMYKHVKDITALKNLDTPFLMHNGYVAANISDFDVNPVCMSVKKYITSKSKQRGVDFSALSHSLEKDIQAARDDYWDDDDIFGGWKEYDYGHC